MNTSPAPITTAFKIRPSTRSIFTQTENALLLQTTPIELKTTVNTNNMTKRSKTTTLQSTAAIPSTPANSPQATPVSSNGNVESKDTALKESTKAVKRNFSNVDPGNDN